MKIAFFDTKPYDLTYFEPMSKDAGIDFKFYETKLNANTVSLAKGYDGVCAFVNDTVDGRVIERLHALGVKIIALRCAGFNNVDCKKAAENNFCRFYGIKFYGRSVFQSHRSYPRAHRPCSDKPADCRSA